MEDTRRSSLGRDLRWCKAKCHRLPMAAKACLLLPTFPGRPKEELHRWLAMWPMVITMGHAITARFSTQWRQERMDDLGEVIEL